MTEVKACLFHSCLTLTLGPAPCVTSLCPRSHWLSSRPLPPVCVSLSVRLLTLLRLYSLILTLQLPLALGLLGLLSPRSVLGLSSVSPQSLLGPRSLLGLLGLLVVVWIIARGPWAGSSGRACLERCFSRAEQRLLWPKRLNARRLWCGPGPVPVWSRSSPEDFVWRLSDVRWDLPFITDGVPERRGRVSGAPAARAPVPDLGLRGSPVPKRDPGSVPPRESPQRTQPQPQSHQGLQSWTRLLRTSSV